MQGGPLVYGALLGAFGVGAVGGAVLQGRLRDRMSSETIVRLAFAGFAVCSLGLAVSPSAWTSGLATMVGGACWVLALSLFNVTVQLSTPRWVVGRALALYQTAAFGGMALGSWLWGAVAERHDSATALVWAAGAIVAGGAVGLLLPLPGRAELNLDPLNRWQEPPVSIDIRSRSGPIQIEVEYRIAEEDVSAFLALMAERHRIRVRDGARHWALQRDLEDPSAVVRDLPDPDLARLRAPQPPPHPRRRRGHRPPARPQSGRRAAARASPDRSAGALHRRSVARQSGHPPPLTGRPCPGPRAATRCSRPGLA